MSKRFEEKKEAFELLNRELSDLMPLDKKQESGETSVADDKQDVSSLTPSQGISKELVERLYDKAKVYERVYKFYRNIIGNMSSSLICIDMKGSITFLNTNAAKTLDYRTNELLGKNLLEIISEPEVNGKIIDLMLIPNKRFESKEVKVVSKAGAIIPIGFSTAPLIEKNEQIGVIITFRDLTEMSMMRQQVERMDRLATMGELATGIAHEVRNPLGGIKTAAQVLEESFEQNDPRLELVSRIVREIDRVNNLLTDFFKFAKPVKPARDYFNVETVIDSIYLLLATQLNKKQIRFREEFSDVVPQIYADSHQVEQVLMNIFLNALQSMPNGGDLVVRTSAITIGEKPHLQWSEGVFDKKLPFVAIEIVDQGAGISPENIEKIFNPFFTTKSEGMGLGLSICSRLIAENHGHIHVSSEVGKGSTFTVVLPTR
ncbi:MAG: PAS domain S-box protein [Bacteroidetes bacterium]|nr:PAS domain S-box protein [Bacteroidota bacterium]